ncbi:glycyl-tRNA synthetase [Nonlabens tegetincola]|uniref:Glycyl-tRNA synthetase n=1 Tax=Nonlabens tegetincola TaxID=323273 RepID=A0A090PZ66_9FLAO|nr:glycyl-tRNA synthetase [Nonlabens tegetincola]
MAKNNDQDQFKKVLSHAKEYGYVFQSSEIYDAYKPFMIMDKMEQSLKRI